MKLSQFAKVVNCGLGINKFTNWIRNKGFLFKRDRTNLSKQPFIDKMWIMLTLLEIFIDYAT